MRSSAVSGATLTCSTDDLTVSRKTEWEPAQTTKRDLPRALFANDIVADRSAGRSATIGDDLISVFHLEISTASVLEVALTG
jgi:hypothetical protein